MLGTSQDFVTQFHNLEGNTTSERKKTFFKLLRRKELFVNEHEKDKALKSIKPKTYLESLLYVDALIFFKRTLELLEVLKQGNEVHISKIIKQPWFFKEAFRNMTTDEFVNDFLPHTSFAIRMKILKKLSVYLDEDQIDEVFDSIHKRYGLHVATKILHACSSTKVIDILSNNEITLQPHQVKVLLDKNLDTFKYYIDHHVKTSDNSSYNNSWVNKYLAISYPEEMLKLERAGKIVNPELGRRASKKFVDLVKDDVIKDLEYYSKFLDKSIIVRKLRGHFKDMYVELFPKEMEDINHYNMGRQLLAYYPKRKQWDLFTQAFSQVFGRSLEENIGILDYSLVSLCPDKRIIQKWAELKYKDEDSNDFLKYIETSKAVPIIKEKINVTSNNYDRLSLLKLMIDTCVQNEDLNSLESVLKYFCFRHRNEEARLRVSFLCHIVDSCKLETFTEKHWPYINEQIKIMKIKKEFSFSQQGIFLIKYLEYLFKNGKPFKDELRTFVEDVVEDRTKFLLDLENSPSLERDIFIQIINIIPEVIPYVSKKEIKDGHLDKTSYAYSTLISNVIDFSTKNKDYFIDLSEFPVVMNFMRHIFNKKTDFHYWEFDLIQKFIDFNIMFLQNLVVEKTELFSIIVKISIEQNKRWFLDFIENKTTKHARSELENDLLQLYFNKIIDSHESYKIYYWCMKNEPQTILPYIDKVIVKGASLSSFSEHLLYLKEIKLLSHFYLDVKYMDFFKTQLKDPEFETNTNLKLFSILVSTEDLITIVEKKYLPSKEKLDLLDEEMTKTYTLQRQVVDLLKHVTEPFKMLPVVLKFCLGDYLQSAIPSLYSVFYRSPERELPLYIDILAKRAVSVKKHAVFLSCELLNCEYVTKVLKTMREKNVSNQKHLFLATLKYFSKNPSNEIFEILISNMHTIDKNDTETLNTLTTIKIPSKFQIVYIEKCWQYYENLKNEVNVSSYLEALLEKLINSSHVLCSATPTFCRNIIVSYFKQRIIGLNNIELFTCKVLRYMKTEQIENFKFVFDIIATFKINNEINHIKTFFSSLYSVAQKDMNETFIKLCIEHWSRVFSPLEMFNEMLLLKLLLIKQDSTQPFIVNYAKNVVTLFDELLEEYGPHIFNKFKSSLTRTLEFNEPNEKYVFLHEILKFRITPSNCILVIDLMNNTERLKREADIHVAEGILKILKNVDEPIVKVYYNCFINNPRT